MFVCVCKLGGGDAYVYLHVCSFCILRLAVQTDWVAFCWKSQQLQGSTAHW